MKQLRIIIVAFILLTAALFIWITASSDPESLLMESLRVSDQRLILVLLLLCALTLLSTLSGLPVFYISIGFGFLAGFMQALLICWAINLVAVMATFYLVRFAFTSVFREHYGKRKIIRRINRRIHRYGIWSVAFSRAVYIIPTNVINFSFPLSRIAPRSYFLGSLLGLLPECLVNVLAGNLIRQEAILLTAPAHPTWQVLVIGGSILLFALVFILLRARQKKRRKFRRLKAVPY